MEDPTGSHQRRLFWAMKNRARPDPAKPAANWVVALARELEGCHSTQAEISAIFSPLVDEEFRRHCRVGEVRSKAVTIHVDHPAYVSYFRLRWTKLLRDALQSQGGFYGVVFEYGLGGANL